MSAPQSLLRHVVLFGFKPQATAADIEDLTRRFSALRATIPGIKQFEWGTDVSPEGLAKGHSHCFTLTFETAAARDAYLPHPAHVAFVDWAGPFIETALVVDYWARPAMS